MPEDRRLVYSTDGSLPLPKPAKKSSPAPPRRSLPDDGVVRVGCERRRASTVTLLFGLPPHDLPAVEKALKRLCGTGGTAKNGTVELQGDHRDAAIAYLAERGLRAKRMGG